MTYALTFDASACTGCKACQEACRDKNDLPGGVLWRWVIEVAGGEWKQSGETWENSVFAYNLSLACNHCVHPKCAGVCPVDAFQVRPDGIVLIDGGKCMGCGYCAWACPYGAPQYLAERGVMSKCNFCYDSLDAGLPPSCVAACPLRALDFVAVEATTSIPAPIPTLAPPSAPADRLSLWLLPASAHPFPLPPYSRTEPHLAIRPHPAMANPLAKQIANREELPPLPSPPPVMAGLRRPLDLHPPPGLRSLLTVRLPAGIRDLILGCPYSCTLNASRLISPGSAQMRSATSR